jgi:hypothetical protein
MRITGIARERLLMALWFAGLPLLLYALMVRPSLGRIGALQRRIHNANLGAREFTTFTPVTREERAFLEAPGAPWRSRIEWAGDDAARLSHVNRLVGAVDAALAARGLRIAAMRVAWDPVLADFTLPDHLVPEPLPEPDRPDQPENRVGGLVLEVEIAGSTEQLFKALAAVPEVNPLLEPVGLHWEPSPDPARPGYRQYLLLRNYFLTR